SQRSKRLWTSRRVSFASTQSWRGNFTHGRTVNQQQLGSPVRPACREPYVEAASVRAAGLAPGGGWRRSRRLKREFRFRVGCACGREREKSFGMALGYWKLFAKVSVKLATQSAAIRELPPPLNGRPNSDPLVATATATVGNRCSFRQLPARRASDSSRCNRHRGEASVVEVDTSGAACWAFWQHPVFNRARIVAMLCVGAAFGCRRYLSELSGLVDTTRMSVSISGHGDCHLRQCHFGGIGTLDTCFTGKRHLYQCVRFANHKQRCFW
uniref:Secreted protein n=1 Tax=Macrostomum lignano TaxID=282301 RepID=A0A1I8JNS4_9PLAT